jgi:hypothetical protein
VGAHQYSRSTPAACAPSDCTAATMIAILSLSLDRSMASDVKASAMQAANDAAKRASRTRSRPTAGPHTGAARMTTSEAATARSAEMASTPRDRRSPSSPANTFCAAKGSPKLKVTPRSSATTMASVNCPNSPTPTRRVRMGVISATRTTCRADAPR